MHQQDALTTQFNQNIFAAPADSFDSCAFKFPRENSAGDEWGGAWESELGGHDSAAGYCLAECPDNMFDFR